MQKFNNCKVSKLKNETYPNIEFNILISYCFNIKSNSGNCCNRLTKFKFIQNSCFLLRKYTGNNFEFLFICLQYCGQQEFNMTLNWLNRVKKTFHKNNKLK